MASAEPNSCGVSQTRELRDRSGLASLVLVARHHGMHLSVQQMVHDNVLKDERITIADILKCAQSAKLKAKAANLNWNGLGHLKRALPAIVLLKNGSPMVLLRLEGTAEAARVVLQDPNAADGTLLIIDRARFEDAWSGDAILVKRNYEIADESQPFSIGLIVALIFRERWVVRDIAVCAIVLSFLALAPIVFWRILSDKVVYFKAYNTFFVVCLAMSVLVLFEAIFAYV